MSSSFRELSTHAGVSLLVIHSASPVSLCLKSGAFGFLLVERLSQKSLGLQNRAAQRPSTSLVATEPPPPPDPPPLPPYAARPWPWDWAVFFGVYFGSGYFTRKFIMQVNPDAERPKYFRDVTVTDGKDK